mgnify:CR=1 FL=1
MRKEEKAQIIDQVAALLEETPNFYVTDISGLNAEKTSELRRACFGKEIKLLVVKNTLFVKALEKLGRQEAAAPVINIMEGPSAIMFTTTPNAPAKLIKDVAGKGEIPALKGAYAEESFYVGADQLETLIHIKSKNELLNEQNEEEGQE